MLNRRHHVVLSCCMSRQRKAVTRVFKEKQKAFKNKQKAFKVVKNIVADTNDDSDAVEVEFSVVLTIAWAPRMCSDGITIASVTKSDAGNG